MVLISCTPLRHVCVPLTPSVCAVMLAKPQTQCLLNWQLLFPQTHECLDVFKHVCVLAYLDDSAVMHRQLENDPPMIFFGAMRSRGCAQSACVVSWSQEPSVLLPLERPRVKAARHIPEMQKSWGEFHQWKGWRCGHKQGGTNLTTTCRQSEWEHTVKLRVNSVCATHSFGSDRLPMLDTHLRRRSLCCCPPLLLRCPARPMAPFGPV